MANLPIPSQPIPPAIPAPDNAILFKPTRVGRLHLSHRVVMAPLTRLRATDAHVPTAMMADMYAQRANPPGTLLISEAVHISPQGGGMDNVPGIWSDEQVEGWKKVTSAVHEQGSHIFIQLWFMGRSAIPSALASTDPISCPGGPYPVVAPSAIADPDGSRADSASIHELTHDEILQVISDYGKAAANAIRSGFDGVEVHGAHGYLVDQFLQDSSNQRTDEWGGSVEKRSRFGLEVMKAIVNAVGEDRAAIRLSPFTTIHGMHMKHPQPQFAHFVSVLRESYPRLAYLHVVEPRMAGVAERDVLSWESNDFLRAIWKGGYDDKGEGAVFLSAGGYTPQTAIEDAERNGDLIVMGRWYISNPDLPMRIKRGIELSPYNRNTFYANKSPQGYVDHSFADAESEALYHKSSWAGKWTKESEEEKSNL